MDCITGEMHIGGQEHFYLETHVTLAVPKEDEEMELFVSSQSPNDSQVRTSWALDCFVRNKFSKIYFINGIGTRLSFSLMWLRSSVSQLTGSWSG